MTFDNPDIKVSVNTNPVSSENFTLSLGLRQTLIIPSAPNAMYLVRMRSLFSFYYETI